MVGMSVPSLLSKLTKTEQASDTRVCCWLKCLYLTLEQQHRL